MTDDADQQTEQVNSRAVQLAILESAKISDFMQEHQSTTFVETGRLHVAVALLSIALEHREAILLLARHSAWTSASALLRSEYEALIRGIHAHVCLTDEQLERIVRHGASPTLETVTAQLKELNPEDDPFSACKRELWGLLSDYSHGGARQLSKWIGPENIEPTHSDDEILHLLWMINLFGLLASLQICEISGKNTAEYVALAGQHLDAERERQQRRSDNLGLGHSGAFTPPSVD